MSKTPEEQAEEWAISRCPYAPPDFPYFSERTWRADAKEAFLAGYKNGYDDCTEDVYAKGADDSYFHTGE